MLYVKTTQKIQKIMNLPIQISPNPLVISTIEIRFFSEMESADIFPLVYSKVMSDLPKLNTDNKIPKEFKNADPQFAYLPDYTLSNNDYLLSFSNRAISFEHVGEYKLWDNYFAFIKKHLQILFSLNFIQQIERIGVRYGSIFDKEERVEDVLNHVPSTGIQGYEEKFENHRATFQIDTHSTLLLQIFANAKASKNEKSMSGIYIDIDASHTEKLSPNNTIIDKIDKLHSLEKELFFKILKPSFIERLNPKYK